MDKKQTGRGEWTGTDNRQRGKEGNKEVEITEKDAEFGWGAVDRGQIKAESLSGKRGEMSGFGEPAI